MTTVFIVIGTVIVGLIILTLLIGKEMIIEGKVVINASIDKVFDYVKHTKNQDNFSVWNMRDLQMNKKLIGTDGQIGFIYSWDSTMKNVGAGEQEIVKLEANKLIEYQIRFKRPMESMTKSTFTLENTAPNQTTIQWGFYS